MECVVQTEDLRCTSSIGLYFCRHLLSHLSGIRHYLKVGEKARDADDVGDGRFREFHLDKRFKSVGEAIELFKEDELFGTPGEL